MMTATATHAAITLSDILPAVCRRPEWRNVVVTGLTSDSRQVKHGDVFVALCGQHSDAWQYVASAIAAGAIAVLLESDQDNQVPYSKDGIPVIPVANLTQLASGIACAFYGAPSTKIKVIGITGTNGKTSTAFWLAHALHALGHASGIIGTLGSGRVGDAWVPTGYTTPDAITTQRLLAEFVAAGVTCVVMEVSSHSLVQGRVAAVRFAASLFTNLTHDHLDYHGDMQAYGEAKAKLFLQLCPQHALINIDDDFGRVLVARLPPDVHVATYSLRDSAANFAVSALTVRPDGMSAVIKTCWGDRELHTQQIGAYNLANLLGVFGVLCALGIDLDRVVQVLARVPSVPGRLERIDSTAGIQVFVDYAHTPDALRNVLLAIRQHTSGRVWCVFGCGGDRDREKRAVMGSVVSELADICLITSDNPRSEEPATIIADIRQGIHAGKAEIMVQPDRALAIRHAIRHACTGDTVLLAGKGHEQFQLIASQQLPFSDVKEARLALRMREEAGVA